MRSGNDLIRRLDNVRLRLAEDIEYAPDLNCLSQLAGLSPHHLLRAFRMRFGETPHAFVTRLRMERAKAALRSGQSVTTTCVEVGFSSLGSFSTLFKRHVGVTPREYRAEVRRLVPSTNLAHAIAVPFCFVWAFVPDAAAIATSEKSGSSPPW